jgi:hypothetical protein
LRLQSLEQLTTLPVRQEHGALNAIYGDNNLVKMSMGLAVAVV